MLERSPDQSLGEHAWPLLEPEGLALADAYGLLTPAVLARHADALAGGGGWAVAERARLAPEAQVRVLRAAYADGPRLIGPHPVRATIERLVGQTCAEADGRAWLLAASLLPATRVGRESSLATGTWLARWKELQTLDRALAKDSAHWRPDALSAAEVGLAGRAPRTVTSHTAAPAPESRYRPRSR